VSGRGLCTVADIRARCCVDRVSGCWHWLGAMSDRTPRIYTFDHERGEKRSMSGPKAVWNIAHGASPLAGYLVYRRCITRDCVNPVHMGEARDKAAIGLHIRRNGCRQGTSTEQRRANMRLAWAAAGIVKTPDHVIAAILAADLNRSNGDVGRELGIAPTTVSKYRIVARRAA